MKLAVLLLSCTASTRVTDFEPEWVVRLIDHMVQYYHDQSGGRVKIEFRVFDWFQLPQTSQQWNDLGFGAGPVVKPLVESGLQVDLAPFDHFALVIDKADAASAAVSPIHPTYVHVGAQSLDPALLEHECGHFFGAGHANLDTPDGPAEYDDPFCVMGREGGKYSFVHTPLNRPHPDGSIDTSGSDSGPGMAATTLRACGWLDLSRHAVDLTSKVSQGTPRTTVTLAPLRGAPVADFSGTPVCAFIDGLLPDQRIVIEYRSCDGWDICLPAQGPGWMIAHLTGLEDRSHMSLQIGALAALPENASGNAMITSKGALLLKIEAASSSGVTFSIEVLPAIPASRGAPAAVSWGADRIDIFGRGLDNALLHKTWAEGWLPSQDGWDSLGGDFAMPVAVASWGVNRLDIFGVGQDKAMSHKAWAERWFPSPDEWEPLNGGFTSPPTVVTWGPDRLDIFALGLDQAMWHKTWAQAWLPSQEGWESLGGQFTRQPAACTWGPNRLDVFCVGTDKAIHHKTWANGGQSSWESLGGGFTSPPVVCSWGPERIDIFALGLDGGLWHKAWAQGWIPSQGGWESLGGKFLGIPAVVSWGPGRLDIFAVGVDGAIYHKAWENGWLPSLSGWETLGGLFASSPTVVSWGEQRLDIFALGMDFSVWHKAWAQGWSPSQTGWEQIGGEFL